MGQYDYIFNYEQIAAEVREGTSIRAAMGEVIIVFEKLDEMLATAISFMLRRGDQVGRIVTAQLSFKAKADLFGALFKADRPNSILIDMIDELCKGCQQIEEERNKVVHSKWEDTLEPDVLLRSKITARAKHGLKRVEEPWQPGQLISVGFHCSHLTHEIDRWMFAEFGKEYGLMEDT